MQRSPKPFRIRWFESKIGRLAIRRGRDRQAIESFTRRTSALFKPLTDAQVKDLLGQYELRYGAAATTYAVHVVESLRKDRVRQLGATALRLLELLPPYLDRDRKFELFRIVREETLARLRTTEIMVDLPADGPLLPLSHQLHEIVKAQVEATLPSGLFSTIAWAPDADVNMIERIVLDGEQRVLVGKSTDFLLRVRLLQNLRQTVDRPMSVAVTFLSATANVTVRITRPTNLIPTRTMKDANSENPDQRLLAQWSDLELEQRFKAGDVSYPEYVLRNMDQFFTAEEQSELRKIAAMHGLELERTLMEIQIKSRTSEADLQKLLETLTDLQDKGISAKIVSRHETPSGHIEISAKSKRKLGCMPWVGSCLLLVAFFAVMLR